MTKDNQLKSTPLDLTKSKQLWEAIILGFKNIQISKDRKLLMLSINVPEWVCLCLSRKAIEILRQRWRRTTNWKVCTLWHQHRGCANLKTFLSLSFLDLNFQSSINWFLYRGQKIEAVLLLETGLDSNLLPTVPTSLYRVYLGKFGKVNWLWTTDGNICHCKSSLDQKA